MSVTQTINTYLDHDLAVDLARVLTVGPEATARLQAIPDPWEPAADETPSKPSEQPAAMLPAPLGSLAPWLDEDGFEVDEAKEAKWPAILRTPRPAKEPTMMDSIAAPYQPHFDEILAGVRAGRWKTHLDLALTYAQPARWVTALKKHVLAHHCMTTAEWNAGFVGRYGNRGVKGEQHAQ